MNDIKEIWREFPPWLKTFVLGLVAAIAAPTLTALQSIDTATDWHVWLGTLTTAVMLSVGVFVRDWAKLQGVSVVAAVNGLPTTPALLAAIVALLAAMYLKAPQQLPIVDIPAPGDSVVKAFEPGSGFSVASYCKTAKSVTIDRVPGAEVLGTKRVARNSTLDYVEWQDDGQSTAATRWYVGKDGRQAKELVNVVTKDDVDCMRAAR